MSIVKKIKALFSKDINTSQHGSSAYKAEANISPKDDEAEVLRLISKRRKFGKGWEMSEHNYTRYDLMRPGGKLEVKSRTYGSDFDTWIIDTYKIDKLIELYPDDDIYFVNVFNGEYHIFDARYVAECKVIKRTARFKDGRSKKMEAYLIPKKDFIMELKTGKRGKKA